nr:chimeric antigen P2bN-C29C [synthetic construct]
MKYLAAYALVGLSGGTPSKSAVEAVLKAAGVPVDPSRVDALFAEFSGKDFDTVCTEGKSKLEAWGAKVEDPAALFKELDKNGTGSVTFDEFAAWASAVKLDADGDPDNVPEKA